MPGIKNRNKILISSLSMLLINLVIIFVFGTNLFEEIVYIIFYYHVSSSWLSYITLSVSFIFHILFLKTQEIKWSRYGKNSVIVGVFFSILTVLTGILWFNATSGGYNNIFWNWDPRQTMTLILILAYLSYLLFGNMIEDHDKKAKITSILGIVLFPTVPLSYLSAIIFNSLHPLINTIPGESGFIYWNPIKLFILFFNLIAITVFFIYVVLEFTEVDKARDQLNEIIQKRLEEE